MSRADRLAVLGVLAGGVALGLVAEAIARAVAVRVAVWYCIVLGVAALALVQLGRVLVRHTEVTHHASHGRTHGRAEAAEVIAPLQRRISAASRERRLFIAGLQPVLFGLARERIALRHGVDLDAALRAGTARALLGEQLWFWLTVWDEDGPPPAPGELDHVITALEAL